MNQFNNQYFNRNMAFMQNKQQNQKKEEEQSKIMAYPSIEVEKKHMVYARMMLDNVGGCVSEMSSVSLYFYGHIMLEEEYCEIAKTYNNINITEMRHLSIFGELAYKLGEDPRLWTNNINRKTYWTPAYIKYPKELLDILKVSMEAEKKAIKKYECQVEKIDDKCIVDILNRIIIDEKEHLDIFTRLYEKYSNTTSESC